MSTVFKQMQNLDKNQQKGNGLPPIVLWIVIGCVSGVTLLAIIVVTVIVCKRRASEKKKRKWVFISFVVVILFEWYLYAKKLICTDHK